MVFNLMGAKTIDPARFITEWVICVIKSSCKKKMLASSRDEQYPSIEAKAEGAEIHWGNETALVNTDVRGRSYAPAGKTSVTFTVCLTCPATALSSIQRSA
jgi:hypothetical protein